MRIAIIGSGASGGLLALMINHYRPSWFVTIFEKESVLGGNHTWCFHPNDLTKRYSKIIDPLISVTWPRYQVKFPKFVRILNTSYCLIQSQSLEAALRRQAPHQLKIEPHEIQNPLGLLDQFDFVFDGRGLNQERIFELPGFQKFLGIELKFQRPHGCEYPIIMDSQVEQIDGYRFMYALPMDSTRLLLEDTYYSNTPDLDQKVLRDRIMNYAQNHFGAVDQVVRSEVGILPIPVSSLKFDDLDNKRIIPFGLRGGYFHPTTGYSFLQSLRFCSQFVDFVQSHEDLELWSQRYAYTQSVQTDYYYFLNKMMFLGAEPHKRFQIFERFYKLPEGLISRFYNMELGFSDKLRLLSGKPPFGPSTYLVRNTLKWLRRGKNSLKDVNETQHYIS